MSVESVTIVTAFVDIGRGEWGGEVNGKVIPHYIPRTTDTYMERFERLTKLKNNIVVFTESKFFDRIKQMREDIELINIDHLFEDHEHFLSNIRKIQSNQEFIEAVESPNLPEYWSAEYVAINALKSHLVSFAIGAGLCKTDTTAWIDFGYCRPEVYCPPDMEWKFDAQGKINFFSVYRTEERLWVRPIFKSIFTNEVHIQGCHIVAPNHLWPDLKDMVNTALSSLFKVDLIDDDQTLLLMAYRSDPEKFIVHPRKEEDWFVIFKHYNHND